MKTTFIRFAKTAALAAFMFIAFTMSAFAKPIEVDNSLVKQFESQFRGASGVSWKTTSKFTLATFKQDGQKVSVFYNPASELIAVSKEINTTELPRKVQQLLNSRYSNQTLMSAIEFTDAEGVVSYYVQLEDSNNKQSILQSDEAGTISSFKK